MPSSSAVITASRFIPAMAVMAVIFLVSSQPGDQLYLPKYLTYDKAWHMLEYGILAAASLFALQPFASQSHRAAIALGVVCFAGLYGLSDEFHQSFVPLRTACLADVIADTLGATIVTGAWWWRTGGKSFG